MKIAVVIVFLWFGSNTLLLAWLSFKLRSLDGRESTYRSLYHAAEDEGQVAE
jgi:hypothetical protein